MLSKLCQSTRLIASLLLGLAVPYQLTAAGPAPVDLRSTANFVILSGAGITTTGGGVINGDVGASPITGAAIGVTCAQVNGTIYAVDAAGPFCAVIDTARLTTAKGDLTTAYNDAAGRTPVPTGPNLNPGLIPGSGNIGGMVLAPGLYKFTTTALITGADVTLIGGADDVWIFQCAADLQLGSGIQIILAGGAQAKNIFWQVGTSAVLGTSSVFKGTILADQAITMNTSSTIEGRTLAFSAGVVFNGTGAAVPTAPEIGVSQPLGSDLVDGVSSRNFGLVLVGGSTSLIFTITNSGDANLTGLVMTMDGPDALQFTVPALPLAPVLPGGSTTFTVQFTPTSIGLKAAALHIANNDSDEAPFDITLSGTGTLGLAPEIAISQPLGTDLTDGVSSKDFGVTPVGGSTSLLFTITNSGNANLILTGPITFDGADALLFTVTAPPTSPVLPGGSTTFTVRFAPLSAGAKAAALHLVNDDADENPFDIALTGTGSLVAVPEIAISQPLGTDLTDGVSTKDFGSVPVGGSASLVFTITNSGTADLTLTLPITFDGANASLFTVTAQPTSPVIAGGSTTFTVRFAPLSAGPKAAALHLVNNDADENPFDIALIGTGSTAAEIAISQPLGTDLTDGVSTKDFGNTPVGGSASLVFTITNSGSANLFLTLPITFNGADASLFTVTVPPITPVVPGGSTTFTVRFAPVSPGVKNAALHLVNNDADENPFDIALTGTGVAPEIAISQPLGTDLTDGVSTKDFGITAVGGSSSLVFTITNSGSANLTLTLPITFDGADASLFTVTSPPTTPVVPAGSTTFTVRFAPLSPGVKTAALHLVNNDGNESPFDIALTGTGVAPEIAISQPLGTDLTDGVSTKDFGVTLVGSSSSLVFTITNSGSANLTLTLPITFDGADASLFTVTSPPTTPVVPAGSTTFTVRFAPLSPGVKTAALHLVNNDGNESPFDIGLTGTAVAPEIAVEQPVGTNLADGGGKDFGPVLVGTSTSLTFTIRNTGTANLTLTLPITFDGTDASLFTVTTPPTSPVIPGGSTTFTVRFTPLSPGAKSAGMHFANNDGDENPFDLALTATGITPEIVVEQPVGTNLADGGGKDFGPVLVGTSTSLSFTVRNSGSANLNLTLPITIDGPDASLFTVTFPPTTPVIPGGSTTFTVRFTPVSPGVGVKIAALHLANDDLDENPFDLTLTGIGTGAFVVTTSLVTQNPQTSLFEQTVRVTNSSSSTLAAIRLLIQGLPGDVQIHNASGTNGSSVPYVQHNFPLAALGTVDFLIEYYRVSRVPFPSPVFTVEVATVIPATAGGLMLTIGRDVQLASGRYLIDFFAVPGGHYAVQYSSDLVIWKTANPTITSPDDRVQWYDDGPPKTESLPGSIGTRFYRVIQLP